MSRVAGPVVLAVLLFITGVASARVAAKKEPVALDYRRLAGAERCPSRAELERQVAEILGRKPFGRGGRRLVRCTLRGAGESINARVQLVEVRSGRVLGVRTLSGAGPGCEELGRAVALAIALAIDPLAKPPPRPEPKVASGASTGPATAPSRTVSPPPPPPRPPAMTTAPRSAPLLAPRFVPDAGPLTPLGPVPLVALVADAGPAPRPLPDAGPTVGLVPLIAVVADAGSAPRPLPDAGTSTPDAGPRLADAGTAPLDAGAPPLPFDAGVPAAPDAGPEPVEPDAGISPVLAAAPVESSAANAPGEGWRPVVGVGAVGVAGALPGIAGGLVVHAGAASSTASVELEGRWLPGTSVAFGTGTISTSMLSAALVGCARFGPWAACGLTQAGPLSATGQGFTNSAEVSPWVVSVGARGQWEWVFANPVSLRLHVDGAANLIRPRLLVDSKEAWKAPPFSVSVGGGLVGRF